MSVATEITKLNTNIKNAYDEIATKGGTIPQNKNTDNLATAINSIPAGGGGADDYFFTSGNITSVQNAVKKLPDITSTSTSFSARSCYYIEEIGNISVANGTEMSSAFSFCQELKSVGNVYAPNATSALNMFYNCKKLESIRTITLGNVTNTSNMFSYCSKLKNMNLIINTQNCTTFNNMFTSCALLEDVPVMSFASVTSNSMISSMFDSVSRSLTDQSLDNILQTCISATSFTGTKKLSTLGLWSGRYPLSRIQTLPHYQDFIDAGWTAY